MPGEPHRFLLVYGSQTGQSQAIAEEIADVANNKGYHVDLHCFGDTDKKFCMEREPCVVIVTSTTGEGDPPDTVKKFWRRIKKKTLPADHLANVNYALLGLGDSNYSSFGQFPRDLQKRLLSLGAKPFYTFTIADDAVGIEVAVDPWIADLWPALEAYFSGSSTETHTDVILSSPTVLNGQENEEEKLNGLVQVRLNNVDNNKSVADDSRDTAIIVNGSDDRGKSPEHNHELKHLKDEAENEENSKQNVMNGDIEIASSDNRNTDIQNVDAQNDNEHESINVETQVMNDQNIQNNDVQVDVIVDKSSIRNEKHSATVTTSTKTDNVIRNVESESPEVENVSNEVENVSKEVENESNKIENESNKIENESNKVENDSANIYPNVGSTNVISETNDLLTNSSIPNNNDVDIVDSHNIIEKLEGGDILKGVDTIGNIIKPNSLFKSNYLNGDVGNNEDSERTTNFVSTYCDKDNVSNESLQDLNSQDMIITKKTEIINNMTNVVFEAKDGIKNNSIMENFGNTEIQKSVKSPESENIDELTADVSKISLADELLTAESSALIGQCPTPLHGTKLTLGKVLPAYLRIEYAEGEIMDVSSLPHQNGSKFPFAASDVFSAPLTSSRQLTQDGAVKTTLELELDLSECPFGYNPGDAFSVITQNPYDEVDALLTRLGLSGQADIPYTLTVLPDTKKKNPVVPVHIPPHASLRFLFTTCLDIREPPKKATIRLLAEHTADPTEIRWLHEICSMEGAEIYSQYIRQPCLSLLDVLTACPSSLPPITRLIERMSRLQPRPYSASSCILAHPNRLRFAFNVVDIPQGNGRLYHREGVCTGWLKRIANDRKNGCQVEVPIVARTKTFFHLPVDDQLPILLIGPGTGIAPFIGFLEHRKHIIATEHRTVGESWLFFGCRHEKLDFLYREEVEDFLSTGALSRLCVSFSRDVQAPEAPRYVQDNLRSHGDVVVRLIEENGRVYVCGDAKNMAAQVRETIIDIFMQRKGLSQEETEAMIQTLRHERRYLEDIW